MKLNIPDNKFTFSHRIPLIEFFRTNVSNKYNQNSYPAVVFTACLWAVVGLIPDVSVLPNRLIYVRLPSIETKCCPSSAVVITETSPFPAPGRLTPSSSTEMEKTFYLIWFFVNYICF